MDFIELLKVIFQGIIEGITEWLPISSTGHMLLVDEFMKMDMTEAFKDMFLVVIQFGAILAVIVIFWKQLWPIKLQKLKRSSGHALVIERSILSMWAKVIVGCLPAAVIGFLFDDIITRYLYAPYVIAAMLIIYGIGFIVIETWNKKRTPKFNSINEITYQSVLIIGAFQALAMIPGTSRSGATIIGALLLGISRTTAAEYTFFLAIPTMLGASGFKLLKYFLNTGFGFTSSEIIALVVGMTVAFIVSVIVIKFLMSYIKKHDFKIFGWYRIALGVIVLCLLPILSN
ncbi:MULTISPECIES: undecaprenyl-diphosphate phosphatase [unclassified Ruminococcus]|uniref:undecaprenyl-diphosphate phosphatase n=1 Tax=unclassified Ruminococcus TaxID=2608920 RepID=UPI00272EAE04|nr:MULTISPECIES: undecaprenyl-diphosphate phosphatase [unclassified Ruminococcus]